ARLSPCAVANAYAVPRQAGTRRPNPGVTAVSFRAGGRAPGSGRPTAPGGPGPCQCEPAVGPPARNGPPLLRALLGRSRGRAGAQVQQEDAADLRDRPRMRLARVLGGDHDLRLDAVDVCALVLHH